MTVLTKVYFKPPVECVPGLRDKNWSSNQVPHTTSPIYISPPQELMIYNIKQAYEFFCHTCNFLSSHQKVVKIYFSSDLFLLVI